MQWWSRWSELHRPADKSYLILSSVFNEWFFNRAGFLDCNQGPDLIASLEGVFHRAGKQPCFTLKEDCIQLEAFLKSHGYVTFDQMSVMQLDRSDMTRLDGLKFLRGSQVKTDRWASTYLLSFYGELSLQEPTMIVANRVAKDPSVTLMSAERGDTTVGVLAVFRTPGLLGVYCVGTLADHRRSGVAGSLLSEAADIAADEGRLLILQTMISDMVEDFYARRGFKRLYLKHIMRPETAGASKRKTGTEK